MSWFPVHSREDFRGVGNESLYFLKIGGTTCASKAKRRSGRHFEGTVLWILGWEEVEVAVNTGRGGYALVWRQCRSRSASARFTAAVATWASLREGRRRAVAASMAALACCGGGAQSATCLRVV